MRIKPTSRLLALAATLVVASGCHTFQPSSLDRVAPGQDLRVRVTGAFSDSLSTMLMRPDARVVEGSVVSRDARGVMLEIPVNSQLQGIRVETLSQRVAIPEDAFVDIELKELSRVRTAGAVAVIGAAAAAVVISQFSDDSGGAQLPGNGQPPESTRVRPLISLPLSLIGALFGGW